jgi:hypothetical protein
MLRGVKRIYNMGESHERGAEKEIGAARIVYRSPPDAKERAPVKPTNEKVMMRTC